MIVIWTGQLLIVYLIYRDAKEQKMLATVWLLLAILPNFELLADLLYLVIRKIRFCRRTD